MISIVKTKQSGRWVRVHKEQVHIIQNAKDAGIFPTSELLAHATCGNGIEEFGDPATGCSNGDVEREVGAQRTVKLQNVVTAFLRR